MSEQDTYAAARAAFDSYAAMSPPELPQGKLQALQVAMSRWRSRHFGTRDSMAAGVSEELGEMAGALMGLVASAGKLNHVVNKASIGIRGYNDPEKCRVDIADAMADLFIFGMQLCTDWRLDFQTLVEMTTNQVLKRDWTANPETAHVNSANSGPPYGCPDCGHDDRGCPPVGCGMCCYTWADEHGTKRRFVCALPKYPLHVEHLTAKAIADAEKQS